MRVSDFMTTDVVSVEIPGNRDDVLKILKRTGISGVPVLKGGRLVGIITRKDLLRKAEETQLGLLMTPDPITISPDATIQEAAALMIEHSIRRLPVVEGEKLVGIISVADLIAALSQMKIREEIKDSYISQTFASGKRPRSRSSAGSWRSLVLMQFPFSTRRVRFRGSSRSAT